MTPVASLHGQALAERVLLVDLTVNFWEGKRSDVRGNDAVHQIHGTQKDAGRYTKYLIDPAVLKPGRDIMIAAYATNRQYTLPWMDSGARVLLASAYPQYAPKMRALKEQYEDWIAGFLPAFADYVSAWKPAVGNLFRASDYPTAHQLERKFGFKLDVQTLPKPSGAEDFRVTLGDAATEALKARIERDLQEAAQAAMLEVAGRIREVVGHMHEMLVAYSPPRNGQRAEAAFHDTLVTNVSSLIDVLPMLNLTADPALDRIASDMRARLVGRGADSLKASPVARQETADAAREILEAVSQWIA